MSEVSGGEKKLLESNCIRKTAVVYDVSCSGLKNKGDGIARVEVTRERTLYTKWSPVEVENTTTHDKLVRFVEGARVNLKGVSSSSLRNVDNSPPKRIRLRSRVRSNRNSQMFYFAHTLSSRSRDYSLPSITSAVGCQGETVVFHTIFITTARIIIFLLIVFKNIL